MFECLLEFITLHYSLLPQSTVSIRYHCWWSVSCITVSIAANITCTTVSTRCHLYLIHSRWRSRCYEVTQMLLRAASSVIEVVRSSLPHMTRASYYGTLRQGAVCRSTTVVTACTSTRPGQLQMQQGKSPSSTKQLTIPASVQAMLLIVLATIRVGGQHPVIIISP